MRVNHGGTDITVTQQFLNRAYVGTALQQMCCKRVAQGVNGVFPTFGYLASNA